MFNHNYSKRLPPLKDIKSSRALPSISPWVTGGGWFLLIALCTTAGLTTVVKYRTLVRAPMTVRPEGELRVVQSAVEGIVESVDVEINQVVQRGQIIATVDSARLETRRSQLEESIEETQNQIAQIEAQIALLDRQIATEEAQMISAIAMAEAELSGSQRQYSNQQETASASVREAESALALAQDEFIRYQQLVEKGAIAELELRQKESAVEVALAQLDKLATELNPTDASVIVAREKIDQARSQGAVTLSQLLRSQSQLVQQQSELKNTLVNSTQEIEQTMKDYRNTVIKAPTNGTIQSLTLRNPNQVVQPGDTIAQIFPDDSALEVRTVVPAKEISKVEVGQTVKLRVSSCPFSQFGTLPGIVSAISPDAVSGPDDEVSAAIDSNSFYSVAVEPQSLGLGAKEKSCLLQSGLEGSADIIAREETVFNFILRKVGFLTRMHSL